MTRPVAANVDGDDGVADQGISVGLRAGLRVSVDGQAAGGVVHRRKRRCELDGVRAATRDVEVDDVGAGILSASYMAARRLQSPFAVTHWSLPMFDVREIVGGVDHPRNPSNLPPAECRRRLGPACRAGLPPTSCRSAMSMQPSPFGSAASATVHESKRRASVHDIAISLASADVTSPLLLTSTADDADPALPSLGRTKSTGGDVNVRRRVGADVDRHGVHRHVDVDRLPVRGRRTSTARTTRRAGRRRAVRCEPAPARAQRARQRRRVQDIPTSRHVYSEYAAPPTGSVVMVVTTLPEPEPSPNTRPPNSAELFVVANRGLVAGHHRSVV